MPLLVAKDENGCAYSLGFCDFDNGGGSFLVILGREKGAPGGERQPAVFGGIRFYTAFKGVFVKMLLALGK